MPKTAQSIYQTKYESDTKKLKEIENKLKELEKLTPEEQNRLFFKQSISEEIWRKKYKAKNDKSIVDTWKRIAKFLSQNEKNKDIWYLYFFDLLEGFKFTGAGRIIANSDPEKKNVTLQNCWLPGIKVLTKNGYKNIEEITTEDYVLSHTNKWKKVINTFERDYTGNIYKIKFWNSYYEFYATEEHPLLTDKGWIKADELQPNMYVKAGGVIESHDDTIDVMNYLKNSSVTNKLQYDDNSVWMVTQFNAASKYGVTDTIVEKHSKKINRYLKYDKDTGWVLGLLLSDGGISIYGNDNSGMVYITVNEKDIEIAERFSKLSTQIFGINSKPKLVKIQRNGKQNSWIRVELYSYLLAKFLEKLFNGRYSYNKSMPIDWLGQNREFLSGLIKGLIDGDGFTVKNGYGIQLSNEILILQIHKILLRFGIYNSVSRPKPKGKAAKLVKHTAYKITIYKNQLEEKLYTDNLAYQPHEPMNKAKVINGDFYYKIKSVEKISVENEKVYNIAVEDDESYIAWNMVSHNCYLSSKVEDSIEGIMEVAKEAAIIHKMGGGIGYNFSTIRPKGAKINSTGWYASGPISFAHIYDSICRTITSIGGRYGAQMLQLHVSHPDIEEFITAKQSTDSHAPLTRFNLSVQISDDFMNAVKNDLDWDLVFDGKVYKTVKARYLWDLILKHAYDYAEPGIFNIDIANKYNNLWFVEEEQIIGSNPSLPAGTLVYTTKGIKAIETLENKFFFTKNIRGEIVKAKCFKSGNNKPLYKLVLNKHIEIEATPEHKFPVIRDGEQIKLPTAELKVGDRLILPSTPTITINRDSESYKDGLFCGILFGDGYITKRKSGRAIGNYVLGFSFNQSDDELASFILEYVNKRKNNISSKHFRNRDLSNGTTVHSIDFSITNQKFILEIIQKFGVDINKQKLPTKIWELDHDFVMGFLDGWISTDGHVKNNAQEILIINKYLNVIQELTKLLSFYGIKNSITQRILTNTHFLNGKTYNKTYYSYTCKIGHYNVKKLYSLLPKLSCKRKNQRYQSIANYIPKQKSNTSSNTYKISAIIPDYRKADVWDITVYDDTHTFVMEYCVTGNCAEQMLPYNGSCNLGSFNLTQFVKTPFIKDPDFDMDKFKYYIPIAVRFMDNVIDLTQQPSEKFTKRQKFARRIGIGFTGLADTLVMLGIKYSKDNAEEIGLIAKYLKEEVYKASVELAKEKGPAPAVESKENRQKFLQSKFIDWWVNDIPQLRNDILKYGIRNTFLLSVAPTGTISLLMNNISSGIEPIFANSYYRNIKVGEHKTEKKEIMDYAYKLWRDEFEDTPLPDYWVTTNDLTIDDHLEIMAEVQKHIDTSISKTVIIPEDYPFDKYKHLFERAYDLELKGVTVYRPNSNLSAVLETKDENKSNNDKNTTNKPSNNKVENKPKPNKKKKREFMLSGKTYKLKSPKEKYSYYVTINNFIDDNGNIRPFEIFINTKDPRQPIFAFISRLLSALFRRESNLDFIIREMQATLVHGEGFFDPKDGKHVPSLIAYIGKVIKQHIESLNSQSNIEDKKEIKNNEINNTIDIFTPVITINNETSNKELQNKDSNNKDTNNKDSNNGDSPFEICPECGMKGLKVENGCKTCIYCGYSGCE